MSEASAGELGQLGSFGHCLGFLNIPAKYLHVVLSGENAGKVGLVADSRSHRRSMRHQVENDVDAERIGAGFGEYFEIVRLFASAPQPSLMSEL